MGGIEGKGFRIRVLRNHELDYNEEEETSGGFVPPSFCVSDFRDYFGSNFRGLRSFAQDPPVFRLSCHAPFRTTPCGPWN